MTLREAKNRASSKYTKTPKGKYTSIKARAKRRGITFLLSFDEWWNIWQESGHWLERGKTGSSYQMCRYGDKGPYSIDNVYITTQEQNIRDAWTNGSQSWRKPFPLSDDPKVNKNREAVRRCKNKKKENKKNED